MLFCLLLAVLTAVIPLAAKPARAGDKFVAVIITGDLPRYQQAHASFMKILTAGGLSRDQVEVYVQTPHPDAMSWANSIRKAVGLGADLLVTYGAPATLVAKREARSMPVLFAEVYDPVALGIVRDLAVPGGDISGVSSKTPLDTLLRVYQEISPGETIGTLVCPDDPGAMLQARDLKTAGARFGIGVVRREVQNTRDIAESCERLCAQVDVLFIPDSALLELKLEDILRIASEHRVPVISQVPGLSDMGALLTLAADPVEQGQLLGIHALQILGAGQRALTLPIRTPKKVSLVINLKVAKALNLTVPFQALSNATRVIK